MTTPVGRHTTVKKDGASASRSQFRKAASLENNTVLSSVDDASGALNADYTKRVRPLIDLIDRLRPIGLDKDLGLPSIVVVGDQSTGKSSVLEAISGIQLPRGTEIVTRCPLELRLKKSSSNRWKAQIGYSVGKEQQNYIDILKPEDIEGEVRTAQDNLTTGAKSVSDKLISLAVEGPELPDLTLIDLPGIVRLDQKMGEKIRTMIRKYISKEETIILAVIPANVDIATSEALTLARDVDPQHLRTLGVMTKADLVAKGEEHSLLKVLRNEPSEDHFLEKGYIAVKCRGQKALKDNQTLKAALKEEEEFFANAEHFQDLPSGTFGISCLSVRLTDELVDHIQRLLPDLKDRVSNKRKATNDELRSIGDGIPREKSAKTEYLWAILNQYVEKLRQVAEGRETVGDSEKENLHNAARGAYRTFNDTIKRWYNAKVGDARFELEIETSLQRDRGYDLPHFSKFETFRNIITKILRYFSDPSTKCLDTVFSLVKETLTSLAKETFGRFSQLEMKVTRIVSETLEDSKRKTTKDIEKALKMENLVFAQDQHFNKMFDDYMTKHTDQKKQTEHGWSKSPLKSPLTSAASLGTSSNHEHRQVETVLVLTKSYMDIALKRIADYIPMIIRQDMIEDLIEELKPKVSLLIRESSGALDLLVEDRKTQNKRRKLEESSERLEKADKELMNYEVAI